MAKPLIQVQVAQQVYDLLEMHAVDLEKSIEDLESDLRVSGAFDGGDMGFYSPGFAAPQETGRAHTPRLLEEWGAPGEVPFAPGYLPSLLSSRPSRPEDGGGVGGFRATPSLKRPLESSSMPAAASAARTAVTPSPAPTVAAAVAEPAAAAGPSGALPRAGSTGAAAGPAGSAAVPLPPAPVAANGSSDAVGVRQTVKIKVLFVPGPSMMHAVI